MKRYIFNKAVQQLIASLKFGNNLVRGSKHQEGSVQSSKDAELEMRASQFNN